LGIATTGVIYPSYQSPVIDQINTQQQVQQLVDEEQQRVIDEAHRNFLAEQEEIIIEDYFLFLDKIGKIKYAR
jgi:hypothetical protein